MPLCVSAFLPTASTMAWFLSLFNDFYDPQCPKLPWAWDACHGKTLTPHILLPSSSQGPECTVTTDNAIKLLDAKMHNTFCISAIKKLKQILNSNNSYNILHKRQLYIIKQLKQKLVTKNAVLVPADKGTTVDTDTNTDIEKV
jgi:hypothetical protein